MALKGKLVPEIVAVATAATPNRFRIGSPTPRSSWTLLDEGQERFTFQTFDDNKSRGDKRLAKIFHGSFTEHFVDLVALNNKGAGVFITVNETDLKGRANSENMVRPRAVFQEADRPATPEPPLTPHIQVESSPGKFHRYLLIDNVQQIEWADWEAAMRRMVADHGSDPNAKDRARVLRLPGFYHMKNPDAPHMVRIVAESGELPYSWARITEAIRSYESRLASHGRSSRTWADRALEAEIRAEGPVR